MKGETTQQISPEPLAASNEPNTNSKLKVMKYTINLIVVFLILTKIAVAQTYNDLPLLPPKADIETKEILRKTISADRALAQLNGTLLNQTNPTLFLDTIYLQEAKASSEVEYNQWQTIK